jgi:hypothetical protein
LQEKATSLEIRISKAKIESSSARETLACGSKLPIGANDGAKYRGLREGALQAGCKTVRAENGLLKQILIVKQLDYKI